MGQSFALLFNLIASASFIARFTGANVVWAVRITFASLTLAILLDILCLAIFGASHSYSHLDGYELSTAYYLTVTSGIITAMALAALISDQQREHRQFLTPKQRSLALIAYVFMSYLLLTSVIFKYVLNRRYASSAESRGVRSTLC